MYDFLLGGTLSRIIIYAQPTHIKDTNSKQQPSIKLPNISIMQTPYIDQSNAELDLYSFDLRFLNLE